MSLLNDMLRDLSQQQKAPNSLSAAPQASVDLHAQEQRELFYNSSAVKPLPSTLMPSIVVFLVVLGMLLLWKMDLFEQRPDHAALDPQLGEQAAIQLNVAAPLNAEPAADPQNPSERADQLTTPSAPSTTEPELGERIAALESAITNLSTVVANANNQLTNVPGEAELPIKNDVLDAAVNERQVVESDDPTASVSIQEPFAQPANEPYAEQAEPQLSITPNVKWQDQQQAQQARQLVAQGQLEIAIEKLQQFVATASQSRESAKTLLDIYALQENTSAMQSQLAIADYLSSVEHSFYAAKIAVIQQQDAQAIQLLEMHLEEAGNDENYRALLAGLYQRTGMHVEAGNHYRRLLSAFGDKPAYWLGFALSQDALNQTQVAIQAYQRVDQYPELQAQVRSYIQQRIAALQQ